MASISNWLSDLDFYGFLSTLETNDWFAYVFPFLIIYTVIFAALKNVKLFEDKKSAKVIIALVFSLFAIAFPISNESYCGIYGGGHAINGDCSIGDLMMSLFPGVTAFSIGILALYLVAAMLGVDLMKILGDDEKDQKTIRLILGAVGLLVVIYYFARGFGWDGFGGTGGGISEFFTDPLLYILIVFGLFIFYIGKDD
ncbi:MAG: hypothetical protein HRU03_05570 [Nanoarchaeales archaeon]|nr:hypothetical protein [Nanoarchaeales archaeon]